MALLNSLYKAVLCALRRFFKTDKWCAFIAGFVAGLSALIEDKKRRQLILILMLSRFVDTAAKMAVDHEVCQPIPKVEWLVILWCSMI